MSSTPLPIEPSFVFKTFWPIWTFAYHITPKQERRRKWVEKNGRNGWKNKWNKITQCWCNSYLENNENDINDDEAHTHLVQQDFALWKQERGTKEGKQNEKMKWV